MDDGSTGTTTATSRTQPSLTDEDRTGLREAGFSAGAVFDLEQGVREACSWQESWRVERPKALQGQARYQRTLQQSVPHWSAQERRAVEFNLTVQSWLEECRGKLTGVPDKEALHAFLRDPIEDQSVAQALLDALWPEWLAQWQQAQKHGTREDQIRSSSTWSLLSWLQTNRVDLLEELKRLAPSKSSASPSSARRERKSAPEAMRWLTLLVLDLADAEEPDLERLTFGEAYCAKTGYQLAEEEARELSLARRRAHSRATKGLAIVRAAFGAPLGGARGPEYSAGIEVQRVIKSRLRWAQALAPGRCLGGSESWNHTTGAGVALAFLRRLRPRPGMPHRWQAAWQASSSHRVEGGSMSRALNRRRRSEPLKGGPGVRPRPDQMNDRRPRLRLAECRQGLAALFPS